MSIDVFSTKKSPDSKAVGAVSSAVPLRVAIWWCFSFFRHGAVEVRPAPTECEC